MSATEPRDDGDAVRARLYLLLGRVLARPPDEAVLESLRALESGDPGSPLGERLSALAGAAAEADAPTLAADYQTLFIGVGRGELVPYASWYLTGFMGEWPLARLRDDMAALGIARAAGVYETEDHIAALCEMMSGLVSGAFGEAVSHQRQAAFFRRHLGDWAPRFFGDLAQTPTSAFYAAVGALGAEFVAIESRLLRDPGATSGA